MGSATSSGMPVIWINKGRHNGQPELNNKKHKHKWNVSEQRKRLGSRKSTSVKKLNVNKRPPKKLGGLLKMSFGVSKNNRESKPSLTGKLPKKLASLLNVRSRRLPR